MDRLAFVEDKSTSTGTVTLARRGSRFRRHLLMPMKIQRLVLELDVLCKVGTAAAVLGFGQLLCCCEILIDAVVAQSGIVTHLEEHKTLKDLVMELQVLESTCHITRKRKSDHSYPRRSNQQNILEGFPFFSWWTNTCPQVILITLVLKDIQEG
ncbi:unnamed protein product [Musa hybrid cultivar]